MVADLIDASDEGDAISMSTEVFDAMGVTRDFLFERVYLGRGGPPTQEAVELTVQGTSRTPSRKPERPLTEVSLPRRWRPGMTSTNACGR